MHSLRPALIASGLALLLCAPALARTPVPAEGISAGTPTSSSAPRGRWERTGPLRGALGVAAAPDGRVAALGMDGSVWIGGAQGPWRRVLSGRSSVLGPLSSDEAVLRELEARLDELQREGAQARGSSRDPETADEVRREALRELRHETAGHPWFLDEQSPVVPSGGVAWAEGLLVVGREDGLWWSEDEGGRWERALRGVAVNDLGYGEGRWVVGAHKTVWSGGHPSALSPRALPVSATSLAIGSEAIWVGSEAGLWRVGRRAERILSGPVIALSAEGEGVWAGTRRALVRLDGSGAPLERVALGEITAFQRVGTGWIATGPSGSWAEGEGSPVSEPGPLGGGGRGLSGGWLAATDGVYRRVLLQDLPTRAPEELGYLVQAAIGRSGLVEPVGERWAATLLPQLVVEGSAWSGLMRQYSPSLGTVGYPTNLWQVGVRLQWAPGRRRGPASLLAMVDPPSEGGVEVLDGTAIAVAESLVGRQRTRYREILVRQVTQLHGSRGVLLRQIAAGHPTLREAVHASLDLQEIEARLDALTEGAWSLRGPLDG